ncbi:unnamed protein product [Gordionus sp. m RMFG-2023]
MNNSPEVSLNILIGVTGSVAAIKVPELLKCLETRLNAINKKNCIKIVATDKALQFFSPHTLANQDSQPYKVYKDCDEWDHWKTRGDPILHIELRDWADIFLIAPLDANTLAKVANGLSDNLLTCIIRAWDISATFQKQKIVLFAPAMNTKMWTHPITVKQICVVTQEFGFKQIQPIDKVLMCGDVGMGAMEEPEMIVSRIISELQNFD